MSERLADYDFDLPAELIASRPLAVRDASRMMVVNRRSGEIAHSRVSELPGWLRPEDLVVLNDSRVIRARIPMGRVAEIFLLERLGPATWKCMVRPGRKFRVGARVTSGGVSCVVTEIFGDGTRRIVFDAEPDLERVGRVPIPPYLRREAEALDEERYQTVYAKKDGSVAAPTAGLHLTKRLLAALRHVFITLHVGLGTFKPVEVEDISRHVMHEEVFEIGPEAAEAINRAERIVAVGTTVVRVLESQPPGRLEARSGRTGIFIRPPYEFLRVGAMLTNFHLPKSTLIMLVSAFAGRELTLEAYRKAVEERYRFFSYGDCMLIL